MQNYIAVLRGINVGGHRKIKMADLRQELSAMGLEKVNTYIQSGNIVFSSEEQDKALLKKSIEDKIREVYGFEVPTILLVKEELEQVISENPYANYDLSRLYVTFVEKSPERDMLESIQKVDYSPEEFCIVRKHLYFYSPVGRGKSKMSNNFFEKKLKVNMTSRNWRTVNKLLEMISDNG